MVQSPNTESRGSVIAILGVPFDVVTLEDTVHRIRGMIASKRPHYLATANVDFLVQAREDVELMRILFEAHLVLCDGTPLIWAARWLGGSLPERVAGSDLVPRLLAESKQSGWRVFFLGGTAESVRAAETNTRSKYPGIQLVGAYSPPFKPLLEMDHADITARIKAAAPDILFVAFGCPKQEKWISMHYRNLGVPVCVGVGATIDFLAGTFKRAPEWMQRTGTEWIFRMLQEPKRLAKRYFKDAWVFGGCLLRQILLIKRHRRLAQGPPRVMVETSLPDFSLIQAPQRMDAEAARLGLDSWDKSVADASTVLNLSETRFIDSTGVGALIRLHRTARESGHSLVLVCPPGNVRQALDSMKMSSLFTLTDNLTDAGLQVRKKAASPNRSGFHSTGAQTMAWEGEITAGNTAEILASAVARFESLPEDSHITIDLSRVRFVDSSGVGLMLTLKKRAWRRGCIVRFDRPSEPVLNVLRVTKLEAFLTGVIS